MGGTPVSFGAAQSGGKGGADAGSSLQKACLDYQALTRLIRDGYIIQAATIACPCTRPRS